MRARSLLPLVVLVVGGGPASTQAQAAPALTVTKRHIVALEEQWIQAVGRG